LALEITIARRPPKDASGHSAHSQMSVANPLWGTPRIHGERLKFDIDVG
jgi:hypothetical protein